MTINRIIIACAGVAVGAGIRRRRAESAPVSPCASQCPGRTSACDRRRPPARHAREANGQLITRETYTYQGTGRRDPFVSLMNTNELRPLFQDLKLVAVAFDATGRNSVAVLRDVTSKEQYRVKVGQEIGRMRVASIGEKSVVFGIEEFGYSRQETLAMNDSTKVRTQ